MIRTIIRGFAFVAALHMASPAATVPAAAWKTTLPSICYFVGSSGDSIICVGKNIFVLSKDGALLSQSPPLDDTKNISGKIPSFFLTKDKSIVVIVDFCTVKKISLDGETLWSKPFRDSIPGVGIKGFTEDAEGNTYLCGNVGFQSGLIVKRGIDGTFINKTDSSFSDFTSITRMEDSLFVTARDREKQYYSGGLQKFDNKGNFIKEIIDTGFDPPLLIDGEHIFAISKDDKGQLAKRTFFATADILLKKYSMSGMIDTVTSFDFGKLEIPISVQKYRDGFLMVTKSDETTNLGTSYMNYFITKLDTSLKKQWQLHFGTDTNGTSFHRRNFSADDRRTILATHNDTLFKFIDASVAIRYSSLLKQKNSRALPNKTVRVFDLQGRALYAYPAGMRLDPYHVKRLGTASGMKLIRGDIGLEGAVFPKGRY